MQASKWISVQLLASSDEMRSLLNELGDFSIVMTAPSNNPDVSKEQFLETYRTYCEELRKGEMPDPADYRGYFSTFWTVNQDEYVRVPVGDSFLCRPVRPVVQLQYHLLGYSPIDHKFRPMVLGKGSMPWGIQFSYPTLFQDKDSQQVVKVGEDFSNTALFQAFRKWVRSNTVPTPFMIGEKVVNAPMRIGNQARGWINSHPHFREYSLRVKEA